LDEKDDVLETEAVELYPEDGVDVLDWLGWKKL
jgi:hypothetical protein